MPRDNARRLEAAENRLPPTAATWPTAAEIDAKVDQLLRLLEVHPQPDLGDEHATAALTQLLTDHQNGTCPTGQCNR